MRRAHHKIRVNAICPSFFATTLIEKMLERTRDYGLRGTPLGRTGAPVDLRGIVVPQAPDASNFMTGAVIPVDGGATAWKTAIDTLDPTGNKYKLRASMRIVAAQRQWGRP